MNKARVIIWLKFYEEHKKKLVKQKEDEEKRFKLLIPKLDGDVAKCLKEMREMKTTINANKSEAAKRVKRQGR